MGAEDGLFLRPGACCQAQDIGAVSQHSLWREAETWLGGYRIGMKRSTNGRVGVGQKKYVGDNRQRTPPRKIRAQFHGYKHTSLNQGNVAHDCTYQRLTEVNSNAVWR